MQSRLTAAMRTDALDRERFRDMLASPPFRIFIDRIRGQLERSRAQLEEPAPVEALRETQGTVRALRMVLQLPEVIAAELGKEKGN